MGFRLALGFGFGLGLGLGLGFVFGFGLGWRPPFSSASEERVEVERMILLSLAIAAPVKSGGTAPSASATVRKQVVGGKQAS